MSRYTWVIGLIIIIAGIWFWATENIERPGTAGKPVDSVQWSALLPQIRQVLLAEGAEIEIFGNIEIAEEKDITGDGVAEVLINQGAGGAASTFMAVFRVKYGSAGSAQAGKPVLAIIKDRERNLFPLSGFPVGTSAMHGEHLGFRPEKNAIALGSYSLDASDSQVKIGDCREDVHVWNPATEFFEWNPDLSAEATAAYCGEVQDRINNS